MSDNGNGNGNNMNDAMLSGGDFNIYKIILIFLTIGAIVTTGSFIGLWRTHQYMFTPDMAVECMHIMLYFFLASVAMMMLTYAIETEAVLPSDPEQDNFMQRQMREYGGLLWFISIALLLFFVVFIVARFWSFWNSRNKSSLSSMGGSLFSLGFGKSHKKRQCKK